MLQLFFPSDCDEDNSYTTWIPVRWAWIGWPGISITEGLWGKTGAIEAEAWGTFGFLWTTLICAEPWFRDWTLLGSGILMMRLSSLRFMVQVLGGLRFHTFRLRSGGRSYLLGAIRIVELVIENLDKNVFYRNLRRSF